MVKKIRKEVDVVSISSADGGETPSKNLSSGGNKTNNFFQKSRLQLS